MAGCHVPPILGARPPLRVVVMDPLAAPLACKCVEGYAQRDYRKLGEFLSTRLGRRVEVAFAESLAKAPAEPDIVIGKWSVVAFDAAVAKIPIRPVALLTDKTGGTEFRGLFVVGARSPARGIADLKGRTILFGPPETAEKHSAALAALEEHGVPPPKDIPMRPTSSAAAAEVADGQADAAVISSYALALLEGCGTIDKGALRVVGATRPLPFVAAFVAGRVGPADERRIADALLAVRSEAALLAAMESRDGFVPPPAPEAGWPDWRGPRRDAQAPSLPHKLPSARQIAWSQPLAGLSPAGVAATSRHVVVADKSADARSDVFRCFDAPTGAPLWTLAYPAPGEMDFTNAPRAQPLIAGELAYLLGAFGHLWCVRVATGEVVWKRHLADDFGAKRPTWGYAATPLIVGGRLIVNPGAPDASLVALDRFTGREVWRSPGRPAAYASFILATFGGVRQIVGYDAASLGGWEPQTARRLWELLPETEGDYNVPTPVAVGDKLLVATENNGARLYAFGPDGRVRPQPVAANADLSPDTTTPIAADGLVFGCSGALVCLDVASLKTLWRADDQAAYGDHASLFGGSGRVLLVTARGELLLLRANRQRHEVVARLRLCDDAEVWSHPALVGDHLYLRVHNALHCILLGPDERPR